MQKPTETPETHASIILLAAGNSSRLGRPKQLLKKQEESLIRFFTQEALKVSDQVLVILGAYQELIQKEIQDLPVQILYNLEWQEGMASSIRLGIKTLMESSQTRPIAILMVCDQPYVQSEILSSLIKEYLKSDKPIIASEYQNTLGTPVLFHESFYSELLKLEGSAGAKKIVNSFREQVGKISFPQGHFDIDTPEDLIHLPF